MMPWRGLQTHILLQKGGGHTLYRKRVAGGDLRPPVHTLLPSETWCQAFSALAGVGYIAPGRGGGYRRAVRGDMRLVSAGEEQDFNFECPGTADVPVVN